ncbi:MAG TPA: thiamine pyrophosphate-dependent enzyme, partial [Frateuria sp.]|uniref:thiamine pyrophosphate-dependent enzyme n=1 Tax=Frateuria sp. TaxID=2211372 RepID=UPI002D7E3601
MTTRRELANAVRALAMDAVEAAKSGHPGMPMGMADIAEVLWNDFLQHNPANPKWPNRDRFVLSNGHGSMLQYALLHLTGYDLPMAELKRFRQLHSKTAGHPEYGHTPGVETTTGPLGQGLANAVGFALAEKVLAAHFNRPGHAIVDHHTYVFLGDGCLMEGISHEVASLAGTWSLGKLVAIYDDNGISIDGEVHGWFTDDTVKRFQAYGWDVIGDVDGHDAEAIKRALSQATAQRERPTLICCKTIIGFGAPHKQGKEESHGAPLGKDEVAAARQQLGWSHPPFEIPAEIYAGWDAKDKGAKREQDWNAAFDAYAKAHPELAAELKRRLAGELPADWADKSQAYIAKLQSE